MGKGAGSRRRPRRGWRALTWLVRAFIRPYASQVRVIVVLLVIQAVGSLFLPNLNAGLINDGIIKGDAGYIWRTGGIMLGIVLALGVVSVITVHRASRVSMGTGADIRDAIYRQVQRFSAGDMDKFGISSLVTRNVNDVQQVQLFLQMTLTTLVVALLMSVGSVILAIRESPELSLLLGVTVPVIVVAISALVIPVIPLFRVVQAEADRINRVLREQITGIRVIRAFLRTRFEQDRFQEANAGITVASLRANRIFSVIMPMMLGIANLSSVGVIWFGGRLTSEGATSIGNMTAFLLYILQVLVYVLVAVTVIVLIPHAVASAERIGEVLEAVPAITDPPGPVVPATVTGTVEFRHVTFGYPGSERPVLSDLTFTLRPGQTTAIIGGTGSGKTTLLTLIPRFRDPTDGAIHVNGTDVREQAAGQLWSAIGLVPQAAFLFRGTVASNLRFGLREATDEQLWHALDVAQALDFVAALPGGLGAPVDQGGTNLSGGQRQRLSIARAIVRRPRLYLFDDCFSALDGGTDARLRAALRAETEDATVVIVAQRVGTVIDADQIIVLDAGAVAGIGTHAQLLAGCEAYREIVASQLGEEAVA